MTVLAVIAACSSSFDLELIPITVDNQDPFGDADEITFVVEHPDGSTDELTSEIGQTIELSGLPELEGSTIAVRVTKGTELVAFGRTPALTIADGASQTHWVLVSEVDSFAWLDGLGQDYALAQAVAVGNGRFLLIGGTTAKKNANNWVGVPDTASDSVLLLDIDATGGQLAFAEFNGLLPTPIADHTATVLPSGLVLIAGGASGHGAPSTETDAAWILDPWGATGPEIVETLTMGRERAAHRAVVNSDGKVLLMGGAERTSSQTGYTVVGVTRVEAYDPDAGTFSDVDTMDFEGLPLYAEGAALGDNGAIYCGGFDTAVVDSVSTYTSGDECFAVSPDSSAVSALESDPLPLGLVHFQLTSLDDGTALMTGGISADAIDQQELASAQKEAWIFDPERSPGSRWAQVGSSILSRQKHSAVALPDGRVLLVGGSGAGYLATGNDPSPLSCAEIYSPETESFSVVSACSSTDDYNALPTRTLLPSVAYDPLYGTLVAGGINAQGTADLAVFFVAAD